MTDPTAPRDLTYEERATLQDLYAWSDRLTDDWLGLGERLRGYADAWKADVDELRAEVERLTRERDDAEQRVRDIDALWHGQRDVIAERDQLRAEVERLRSAPHCPTCGRER